VKFFISHYLKIASDMNSLYTVVGAVDGGLRIYCNGTIHLWDCAASCRRQ